MFFVCVVFVFVLFAVCLMVCVCLFVCCLCFVCFFLSVVRSSVFVYFLGVGGVVFCFGCVCWCFCFHNVVDVCVSSKYWFGLLVGLCFTSFVG